jgi:hypothetical protein
LPQARLPVQPLLLLPLGGRTPASSRPTASNCSHHSQSPPNSGSLPPSRADASSSVLPPHPAPRRSPPPSPCTPSSFDILANDQVRPPASQPIHLHGEARHCPTPAAGLEPRRRSSLRSGSQSYIRWGPGMSSRSNRPGSSTLTSIVQYVHGHASHCWLLRKYRFGSELLIWIALCSL